MKRIEKFCKGTKLEHFPPKAELELNQVSFHFTVSRFLPNSSPSQVRLGADLVFPVTMKIIPTKMCPEVLLGGGY